MEECYQRQTNDFADYCWSIKRDFNNIEPFNMLREWVMVNAEKKD